MVPTDSTLKIQGELYPCVVHSSSFRIAKVLVRVPAAQWKAVELGSKLTTLTLTFLQAKTGKKELFQFNGTVQILQKYGANDTEVSVFMAVTFGHRPPEGFLEAQGGYLNLRKEASQRQEDRIPVTNETRELLGLASLNTTVTVDHIERKCLIRDLSYNGARVILSGVAPFLLEKPFSLTMPLVDQAGLHIPGTIVRAEAVDGHRGLAVIALGYHPERVPVEYLRALQKGFRLGLGAKKSLAGPRPDVPRTSTIDLKTLKVIPPR